MEERTKYCKHCGEIIDYDCVVCPKCGKQVEQLKGAGETPIVINNSSSSSSSASSSSCVNSGGYVRKMPWYLTWLWILILGAFTGGIYWVVGFILRVNWNSKN